MSTQHKKPMLAFVLLAVIAAAVIGNQVRASAENSTFIAGGPLSVLVPVHGKVPGPQKPPADRAKPQKHKQTWDTQILVTGKHDSPATDKAQRTRRPKALAGAATGKRSGGAHKSKSSAAHKPGAPQPRPSRSTSSKSSDAHGTAAPKPTTPPAAPKAPAPVPRPERGSDRAHDDDPWRSLQQVKTLRNNVRGLGVAAGLLRSSDRSNERSRDREGRREAYGDRRHDDRDHGGSDRRDDRSDRRGSVRASGPARTTLGAVTALVRGQGPDGQGSGGHRYEQDRDRDGDRRHGSRLVSSLLGR